VKGIKCANILPGLMDANHQPPVIRPPEPSRQPEADEDERGKRRNESIERIKTGGADAGCGRKKQYISLCGEE